MKAKTCYFAHPIATYDKPEELKAIKTLEEQGYSITNPNSEELRSRALKIRQGIMVQPLVGIPCVECRKRLMKPLFFKVLAECEVFAFIGRSCGVLCELEEAMKLGKEIISIYPETYEI